MPDNLFGNERYKTKRNQKYDMMRSTKSSFDPIPSPVPVDGSKFERAGPLGIWTMGYGGEKTPDPLLDHIKGIRDETLPNYGRKELSKNDGL